ncbi:hypothetical protein F3Y22_tig00113725pilonHSYRG00344 [Hibiscus syriacus]|uniref:Protein BZR1 homolog n=1 Tax=Hibiscus syriacus TaxID=106335 RepID=A0A6A2WMN2_HIBSY|nr:hypothetical protein F3Y22_tig00113725pilonHSYRG00344 [Hibiscus syriacus]
MVASFVRPSAVPPSSSRNSQLPLEPYSRGATMDFLLDSAKDLEARVKELKAITTDLNRREKELELKENADVRGRFFKTSGYAGATTSSFSDKGKRELEKEKERTKTRKWHRRVFTRRMLAGLRQYGNFPLPSHAAMNDVLAVLAREAGWTVEPDGTTYKHSPTPQNQQNMGTYSARSGESPISTIPLKKCSVKATLVQPTPALSVADVVHDGTKEITSKGFIFYATIEEARKVIYKMNGNHIYGSKIRVSLAKHKPRQFYWRKSSTVVQRKCKNFIKIGNLANQIQAKGLAGFTLMRAAGNAVLMVFEDSDSLRIVKDEKLKTLAEWFSKVETSSESLVVECRRVWLVCEGIPFHAWNWNTLKNIASKWGKLVAIDNSGEFPLSFDRDKIQILTKVQGRIDELMELKVGDNLFKIMVHEVDHSFKPNSWVPEDCVISLELVPSIDS